MERRYGRANSLYHAKIKTEKKKISLEVLLKRQIICCVLLLAAGICVSYFDGGGKIRTKASDILYTTNSLKDWKGELEPIVKSVRGGAVKTVKTWNKGIEICEKKLSIKDDQSEKPGTAKADTANPKKKKSEKTDKKTNSETDSLNDADETEADLPISFFVPTEGEISSVFGSRQHPVNGATANHTGIDIAASEGQTVVSACVGTVLKTGEDSANGKYVIVEHKKPYTTVYAHLSKISVTEGESVSPSIKIGEVGTSGISTGPHLHFEIKINGNSVNPEDYISLKHREGI